MRHLDEIIVHCSATNANWAHTKPLDWKVAEIRRWHLQRRFNDIGYHYIIDRDGTYQTGRDIGRTGAHVRGHNTSTVGICLLGGYGSNEKDDFSDHFTKAQDKTARELIAKLQAKYPTIEKVSGHNQYAAKACPGFHVPTWLAAKPMPKKEPVKRDDGPDNVVAWSLGTIWMGFLAWLDGRKGK